MILFLPAVLAASLSGNKWRPYSELPSLAAVQAELEHDMRDDHGWVLENVSHWYESPECSHAAFEQAVDRLVQMPYTPMVYRYLFQKSFTHISNVNFSDALAMMGLGACRTVEQNQKLLLMRALEHGDQTLLKDFVDYFAKERPLSSLFKYAFAHQALDPFKHLSLELRETVKRLQPNPDESYPFAVLVSDYALGHPLLSRLHANVDEDEKSLAAVILALLHFYPADKIHEQLGWAPFIGMEKIRWIDSFCTQHGIETKALLPICPNPLTKALGFLELKMPLSKELCAQVLASGRFLALDKAPRQEFYFLLAERHPAWFKEYFAQDSVKFKLSFVQKHPQFLEHLQLDPHQMPDIIDLMPLTKYEYDPNYLKYLISLYGVEKLQAAVNRRSYLQKKRICHLLDQANI